MRRLVEATTTTLTLEYRILVADAAAAAALQKEIAAVSPEQFKKDFSASLETDYEGVTVAALIVEPTRTAVEYIVLEPAQMSGADGSSDSGSTVVIGAIFGGILGMLLIGGTFYALKKKGSGLAKLEEDGGRV
jgi:hypothetical protein